MENKHIGILVVIAVIVVVLILVFALGGKKAPEAAPPAPEATTPEPAAPAPEPEPAAPAEETVEIPETEAGEAYVSDEALESGEYVREGALGAPQYADTELAKDLTVAPERFSNFECTKNDEGIRYISIKVTNTNADMDFMISPKGVAKGYNTYFMTNGMVDEDPGCAVEQLAPGASTVCNMIGKDSDRYGNVAGPNRITIQSPDNEGKTKAEAVVVNCPA